MSKDESYRIARNKAIRAEMQKWDRQQEHILGRTFAENAQERMAPAIDMLISVLASPSEKKKLLVTRERAAPRYQGELDLHAYKDFSFGTLQVSFRQIREDFISFYVVESHGKTLAVGPRSISANLNKKLSAAGIEYVAQEDKKDCAKRVDAFIAARLAEIKSPAQRNEMTAGVIASLATLEPLFDRFVDDQTVRTDVSFGKLVAEALGPKRVTYATVHPDIKVLFSYPKAK